MYGHLYQYLSIKPPNKNWTKKKINWTKWLVFPIFWTKWPCFFGRNDLSEMVFGRNDLHQPWTTFIWTDGHKAFLYPRPRVGRRVITKRNDSPTDWFMTSLVSAIRAWSPNDWFTTSLVSDVVACSDRFKVAISLEQLFKHYGIHFVIVR